MSVIWLDEPPYVIRDGCRCWADCKECTRREESCLCEACPEEQWEINNADY